MYGQHFTILRYGIPYGPRMRDALVVARFARAALAGLPITIAGTGEQQRNYIYVEDLADAHVRALSSAAQDQTLALEGDTPVSVREVAETVLRLAGPVPVRFVPARAGCRRCAEIPLSSMKTRMVVFGAKFLLFPAVTPKGKRLTVFLKS